MTMIRVPLNKLFISEKNVSDEKPNKQFLKELLATLMSVGQIQNLCVFKSSKRKGFYEVFAGGKRYTGFQLLADDKLIPKDYLIDCKEFDEEQATEISTMENLTRTPMHPADAFIAFQTLIDEGKTVKDITERFGYSQNKVKQLLKLANVSPILLQYYKAGKVTQEAIMAYTVSDDHERQMICHKQYNGRATPFQIRKYLTDSFILSTDPIAKFVTVAAYKKAGGATTTDLFEKDTYLLDTDLLHDLAVERLDKATDKIEVEGWKWIEASTNPSMSLHAYDKLETVPVNVPKALAKKIEAVRAEIKALDSIDWDNMTDKQQDRVDEAETELWQLEEEQTAFHAFKEDEKQYAGCIVSFNSKGELVVTRGLLLPDDTKALRGSTGKTTDNNNETPATIDEPKPIESNALVGDLSLFRQQIAQVYLAKNPKLASDVLLYTLCSQLLESCDYYEGIIDARFEAQHYPDNGMKFDETKAALELLTIKETLNMQWVQVDSSAEQFAAFCELTNKEKTALMAYCVAMTLSLPVGRVDNEDAMHCMLIKLECNVPDYWRPTGECYFSRISKPPMLELGQKWFGADWVTHHNKLKKGELVDVMHNTVNGDKLSQDKETVETIDHWLPEPMVLI